MTAARPPTPLASAGRVRATETQRALLDGLRAAGGRATLGDLMAATALPAATIEAEILGALSLVGGHVAVDEQGVLTYRAGRRARRYGPSPWEQIRRALYAGVRFTVYGGLVFVLVAYFFVYVVLLVLALVAALRAGDCCDCDDDGDCGGACFCATCDGCDGCDGCDDRGAGEGSGRGAAGDGEPEPEAEARRRAKLAALPWKTQLDRTLRRLRERLAVRPAPEAPLGVDMTLEAREVATKPPLHRAVRDWVFGPPERSHRTSGGERAGEERNVLAFLRAHAGRLTASEVAWLTGRDLPSADGLALDLAARYEGDIEVTDEGALVYTFERLVTRAGAIATPATLTAWVRQQGGAVTVRETAEHLGLSAQEALETLQRLTRAGRGRLAFEDATRFILTEDEAARGEDGEDGEPAITARDAGRPYTFAWERLETEPSLHGHPRGTGRWIPGLSGFNLALSLLFLPITLYDPALTQELVPGGLSPTTLFWALGVLPLVFSGAVFLIPQLRRLAWRLEEPKRRARNAWKLWLLLTYRGLLDGPVLTTEGAARALFAARDERAVRAAGVGLDELRRRLEGEVDAEAGLDGAGGYVYRFPRLDAEHRAAERLRQAFDPGAHVAGPAVFDSGDEGW